MSLSAAQRSKIRRLSQPVELAPSEEGGELNIVPFLDIIVNILIFVLATVAVTFTASIETTPPASRGSGVRSEITSEALNLTVLIVNAASPSAFAWITDRWGWGTGRVALLVGACAAWVAMELMSSWYERRRVALAGKAPVRATPISGRGD